MIRTLIDILKLGWGSKHRWYYFSNPLHLWSLIKCQWPDPPGTWISLELSATDDEMWRNL